MHNAAQAAKPCVQTGHIVLQRQFFHMHPVQVEPGGNHWPYQLHSDTLPWIICREDHLLQWPKSKAGNSILGLRLIFQS